MELTIVTITYNIHPEIFLLQIEAIRKFCKDDFVIEVIDNSSNEEKAEAIRYHADILGVSYRKTHANSFNGSDSHAFAANFSFQILHGNGSSFYMYIDHDCLPILPFSVKEILGEEKLMAGIGQLKKGTTYFWQGCIMWNANKVDNRLIDFSPNVGRGLDTGGNLYKVIDYYGKDNFIFFDEQYCENPYYHGRYNFYALINKGMFFHCVALSGWNENSDNTERVNSLLNILREKINVE